MNGTRVGFDTSWGTEAKWQNFWKGAVNAAENAAYRARANTTIPANVFVIGLGGQGAIDHTLLQRMANDPLADSFNNPAAYTSCATTTGCVNYSNQPQGTYVYSQNQGQLRQAFLKLSSQILRLSQ